MKRCVVIRRTEIDRGEPVGYAVHRIWQQKNADPRVLTTFVGTIVDAYRLARMYAKISNAEIYSGVE